MVIEAEEVFYKRKNDVLDMVVPTLNPKTLEAEGGISFMSSMSA